MAGIFTSDFKLTTPQQWKLEYWTLLIGFLRGGCPRGGGNWGTLRILREDWGTLGKIWGITTPPIRILLFAIPNCYARLPWPLMERMPWIWKAGSGVGGWVIVLMVVKLLIGYGYVPYHLWPAKHFIPMNLTTATRKTSRRDDFGPGLISSMDFIIYGWVLFDLL